MPPSGVPTISPQSLERRIAAGEPLLLLDTRDPATHAGFPFDAPRPVEPLNLPYDRFLQDIDGGLAGLPAPGTAGPIVCFCYRGETAAPIVRALRAAGYEAENLEGGMLGWSELVVPTVVPGSDALGAEAALLQLRRLGKGCLGYALVAGDAALLVDVGRNVESALAAVAQRGAKIARVADTHLHADHISGGPEVARETGAPYALPPADATDVRHAFEPVGDGDVWRVGAVQVRALHTPGHTDGSTSYLVGDRFLLTGDTLFVAGVGRPDLSGQGERLARVLHRTLTATIPALGDRVEILPAHISSAAEVGAAGVASARLGDLKRTTLSGLSADADVFSRSLLAALPEQPPNSDRIRAANRGVPTADPSELEYGPNRCAVTGGMQ
ncbi:MAG: MBL fold metallo-hydrolase [Gemmatimonadetes bacterium]|nr:MBL fold metallo-hydrolase [Gemmatimonadota bacterium]